ncbi:hypothetical protein LCGC14_1368710 [marine sediment metagenome]|uniref:Uncharacterized protein n=1 Tax=marine sediment metagenome TaxID=412755 RepID=A0A0F9N7Z9_9ZZZZ
METNNKTLQDWFSGLEVPTLWSAERRDVLDDLKDKFSLEYPNSNIKKENIIDETDKDIVVTVRWFDGYLESFRAKQVRQGEALLWMRLEDNKNRNIPLRNVRWFSMYPESHED